MSLKMKWDIGNKVLSTVPTLLRTIGCGILAWPTLILLPLVTKALKTCGLITTVAAKTIT